MKHKTEPAQNNSPENDSELEIMVKSHFPLPNLT